MVINGKKLTVKFFLNKDVKGKRIDIGVNRKYPLYIRVTYNRVNTHFIAGNNWFDEAIESELESIPELKPVKSAIEKIVRYEIENSEKEYRITGLGTRIRTYSSNLSDALNTFLLAGLANRLGEVMPHVEYQEWSAKDFDDRVKSGLHYLEKTANKLSNNLRLQAVLADLLRKLGQSINVFGWRMSQERFSFIEKLKTLGKKYSQEKAIPLAFDYIPIVGLEKEEGIKEIVSLIDDACSQLLALKYTSFVEAKSISYDEIENIFNVKLK